MERRLHLLGGPARTLPAAPTIATACGCTVSAIERPRAPVRNPASGVSGLRRGARRRARLVALDPTRSVGRKDQEPAAAHLALGPRRLLGLRRSVCGGGGGGLSGWS